jgi:Spy/CpxP family protein refolding chaperone
MSMTWRAVLAGLAVIAATAQAAAQMPYAGMQTRSLKALSDEQVADLRAGRGMGLALAAELNGYPGPMHVLEHADELKLTDEQRSRVRELFDTMRAEAIPIGRELVTRETELDKAFADRTITADRLTAAVASIGEAQSRLRATHLKYHLLTPAILTESQVRRYTELRGYAGGAHGHHHRRHHPN